MSTFRSAGALTGLLIAGVLVVGLIGCNPLPVPEILRERLHDEWHVFHTPEGIFKLRADGSERVSILGIEGEGDTVSVGLWPALHPGGETLACVWAEGVDRRWLERDVFSATRLSLRLVWEGGQREILSARSPIPMFADSLEFARSDPRSWRFRSDQLNGLAFSHDGKLACIERTLLDGDLVVVVRNPSAGREADIVEFGSGPRKARLSAWRGLSFDSDGHTLFVPGDEYRLQLLDTSSETPQPRIIGYGLEATGSVNDDVAMVAVVAESVGMPHGGAIQITNAERDRALSYRILIRDALGISHLRWNADGGVLLFEAHRAHSLMRGVRSRQLYALDLQSGQHYHLADLE